MKKLLGILVLAAAVWLGLELSPSAGEGAVSATPTQWTSSAQCKACHEEVYAEWEDSWHAKAWIDEDVRVQSADFSNKICIDCHAPRPVFETGIGNRVLPRTSRRAEGVDCISCHLLPDGTIAGTIDNPSAPCRPVARRELQRVDFCAGCHDQHKTVTQWKLTDHAANGTGCIECHMPLREGDPNAGRYHQMAGGHDLELVRSAVALRASRDEEGIAVEVENLMRAHSFPTDERSRAADVFYRPAPEDPEERGGWTHLHRIRDPYRHEVDLPSTLLQATAEGPDGPWENNTEVHPVRPLRIPAEAATGAIEVALFYKLAPYYRDGETVLVTEQVTDPLIDAQLVHRVVVP